MSLRLELDGLFDEAAEAFAGTPLAGELAALRGRLDGPLRVAIAGRVKAGKSTLLNALVGERLAPTDARECTRIVTWYGYGEGYDVSCDLNSGERRPLRFTRNGGRLEIELDSTAPEAVRRIRVDWPSARLQNMTVIDTPGIGSTTEGVSERTASALGEGAATPEADAVIYLMRHMHASDAAFLETFLDTQTAQTTPVNAVVVLSRADEIGGARPGAMAAAGAIAARYASDERVRSLASAVIPVAGLLAETAATLEEHEAEALRVLAAAAIEVTDEMLLSVDQLRQPELGPLTVEYRELLLERFGMYGIRLAVTARRAGQWRTGVDLARLLSTESGIDELKRLVQERFGSRARQLVARSVLESLRAAMEMAVDQAAAARLLRSIEQVEAAAHEVAELRMLDLVWSGTASFFDAERVEAERVTGEGTVAARVGCTAGATVAELRGATIAAVGRWRERASDALIDRTTAACCETMARSYEGLYAAVSDAGFGA